MNNLINTSNCCGGPAPKNIDACCIKDAMEKFKGNTGCGCANNIKEKEPESEQGKQCDHCE